MIYAIAIIRPFRSDYRQSYLHWLAPTGCERWSFQRTTARYPMFNFLNSITTTLKGLDKTQKLALCRKANTNSTLRLDLLGMNFPLGHTTSKYWGDILPWRGTIYTSVSCPGGQIQGGGDIIKFTITTFLHTLISILGADVLENEVNQQQSIIIILVSSFLDDLKVTSEMLPEEVRQVLLSNVGLDQFRQHASQRLQVVMEMFYIIILNSVHHFNNSYTPYLVHSVQYFWHSDTCSDYLNTACPHQSCMHQEPHDSTWCGQQLSFRKRVSSTVIWFSQSIPNWSGVSPVYAGKSVCVRDFLSPDLWCVCVWWPDLGLQHQYLGCVCGGGGGGTHMVAR